MSTNNYFQHLSFAKEEKKEADVRKQKVPFPPAWNL